MRLTTAETLTRPSSMKGRNKEGEEEKGWVEQGGHKPGKPEKPGILRDFFGRGKLVEFLGNSLQPQGKIVKNKVFLVCHSNIYVLNSCWLGKHDHHDPWWRSLLHLLFVAITCGKVSLWLWKSLENSGNFFLLLCGHPVEGKERGMRGREGDEGNRRKVEV